MEEITIIGLDRFDDSNIPNFLCLGILMQKLNFKVNLIYSNKYEKLQKDKYLYLKTLSNFNIYSFDNELDIENIREISKHSKSIIFNPMEYSLNLTKDLLTLNIPLNINFSYLSAKNIDMVSYSKGSSNILIMSRHKHDLKAELANKIINENDTNCIIFKNYGEVNVYSKDGEENSYQLFLNDTNEEFYTYSNIFFTGFIYGQILKKSIQLSSYIGLSLCDIAHNDEFSNDDINPNLVSKIVKQFIN